MKDWKQTCNLNQKNIREFKKNDTIYIRKNEKGHSFLYFCQFISFKRGVVKGKILETYASWRKHNKGDTIVARLINCSLYGEDIHGNMLGESMHVHYHWFSKKGEIE